MSTYIRFLVGMLVLGVLIGFIVPMMLSSASDFLVTTGFGIMLLVIPCCIWLYWRSSWTRLANKLLKEEDHE